MVLPETDKFNILVFRKICNYLKYSFVTQKTIPNQPRSNVYINCYLNYYDNILQTGAPRIHLLKFPPRWAPVNLSGNKCVDYKNGKNSLITTVCLLFQLLQRYYSNTGKHVH